MRFTSLSGTAVAVLAGIVLTSPAVDALPPSRLLNRAIGDGLSSGRAPLPNTALAAQYSRVNPRTLALLNEYTQGLVQLYPFGIITPEDAKVVEEDETSVDGNYRLHALTMIGADNTPFRSVKISRNIAGGPRNVVKSPISKIEINHISQDGEESNGALILINNSPRAGEEYKFTLETSRGKVHVTAENDYGSTEVCIKLTDEQRGVMLNDVALWDRKNVILVNGPRIISA
ncbi:hypothetical protein THASP1DRAFT_27535 [Thamnocephalis sphaerospora]|uniref:Uncharacterized protein n=1 Tax=Thamnocephalis sphaerospora TaxID=78915 RepID=A0A4P9XWH6_9FUNG|nr:hypothetical protein THASP1DRAFT_27535 [Thamnocephalis sphaerospora]|eukprot:RKP10695.1 hypothetical protein THASP1DRAFT_27535 [Thamnocephalis sphaerospora]